MQARRRVVVNRGEADAVPQPVLELCAEAARFEHTARRRIDGRRTYAGDDGFERGAAHGENRVVHSLLPFVRLAETEGARDVSPEPAGGDGDARAGVDFLFQPGGQKLRSRLAAYVRDVLG